MDYYYVPFVLYGISMGLFGALALLLHSQDSQDVAQRPRRKAQVRARVSAAPLVLKSMETCSPISGDAALVPRKSGSPRDLPGTLAGV
ncbi:hypothetical protein GSY71_02125 [Pusillimonas sp. TS35]|jgi:hypothetical protein|uniref:hypothetical protein n=1 Tax=Paracandidimonas lactea TaxID=2895524 RepID=UPI00136AF13E|nr:hypothetical protein [Paracandidimonas lactea]MYN11951.1 hypothetical protein [Pusillimonas sp. TS35]